MRRWVRDPNAGIAESHRRLEEARMKLPNSAVRCVIDGCVTQVRRPEGVNLQTVRSWLRPEGWRCIRGRDLCPDHARPHYTEES